MAERVKMMAMASKRKAKEVTIRRPMVFGRVVYFFIDSFFINSFFYVFSMYVTKFYYVLLLFLVLFPKEKQLLKIM